jgi:hypothetical protein
MRGVPRVAALVLKIYLLSLLRRPRGGTVLARVAVRLFCTQKPARRVYDMWAWVPCQRLDHRLQRSRGGAQPRGGCMLLMRRFASLTAGCGEDGRAYNRRAVARSLCDDLPSSCFGPACMTCEAWPPCHRMGTLVRIGGDLACDASGHERGNLPLKMGSPLR